MRYRPLLSAVAALALTFVTATAQAQSFGESSSDERSSSSSTSATSTSAGGTTSGANSLTAGTSSLSFTVPAGGNPYASGTAGYWYMLTDSFNLGINLGVGIESTTQIENYGSDNETTTQRTGFDLLVAPAVRYYLMNTSSIAPYILGQINFHKFFDGDNNTTANPDDRVDNDDDNYNSDLQPELALIGGFGLEWFPVQQFSVGGHIGLGFDILRQDTFNGTTLVQNGPRIGTFTSALTANLYF